MLLIISPAKTLDETSTLPKATFSQPELLAKTKLLAELLKSKNPADIQSLMEISPKLADLNYTRFQNFKLPFSDKNARPALCTFKGDVYEPLNVADYRTTHWNYATKHLRILSGLYGVLKPLDLMQPYRLEMGTPLKHPRGKNLYDFWGRSISDALNKALDKSVLINLASKEYFDAVDTSALKGRVVDIVFKERHKGALKIIGIHAKRARGLMVEYAIQNQISNPEKLKKFSSEGYAFDAKLSSENSWVFVR